MSKTLLYRLLGIGRLPRRERERLAAQGITCLVEGIPLTIAWREFRQGGRRVKAHRQNTTGTVALTRERLLVYAFAQPVLDIGLNDPAADRVVLSTPARDMLSIRLQARDFTTEAGGQITYWLSAPEAAALADLWQRRARKAAEN